MSYLAQDGCTALICAAWNNNVYCLRELLECGSDKEAKEDVCGKLSSRLSLLVETINFMYPKAIGFDIRIVFKRNSLDRVQLCNLGLLYCSCGIVQHNI